MSDLSPELKGLSHHKQAPSFGENLKRTLGGLYVFRVTDGSLQTAHARERMMVGIIFTMVIFTMGFRF